MVGYYNQNDSSHAFCYDPATTYTTIVVPVEMEAIESFAYGISGNSIVGTYTAKNVDGKMVNHGFFRSGPSLTTATLTMIDVPGAKNTIATGVNGDNIVGYYAGEDAVYHGFFCRGPEWSTATLSTIDIPNAQDTQPLSIDGDNIIGHYVDSDGKSHGWRCAGLTWTPEAISVIDFQGAKDTVPLGVSGNNLVGYYLDGSDLQSHGFLYDGTNYTTLDFPGASQTWASGVNGRNIVGFFYIDAGALGSRRVGAPPPSHKGFFGTTPGSTTACRNEWTMY